MSKETATQQQFTPTVWESYHQVEPLVTGGIKVNEINKPEIIKQMSTPINLLKRERGELIAEGITLPNIFEKTFDEDMQKLSPEQKRMMEINQQINKLNPELETTRNIFGPKFIEVTETEVKINTKEET